MKSISKEYREYDCHSCGYWWGAFCFFDDCPECGATDITKRNNKMSDASKKENNKMAGTPDKSHEEAI